MLTRRLLLPTATALVLLQTGCVPTPADNPGQSGPPPATTPAESPAEKKSGDTSDAKPAAAAAAPAAAAAESVPARDELSADVQKLIAPLTKEQVREGWINLFDGTSLFGWVPNQKDVNWSVAEGTITADSGPAGLLLTSVPFADYELHCEFNAAEGTNSGLFLRTVFDPKDVKADCYELNIADEQPQGFLTGSFVGRKTTAAPIKGSGGWKTFDVTVQGNTFNVKLDGQEVMTYVDDSPAHRRSGFIGLQKNSGKVQFRNVRLKPLGMEPLMNGQDLAGWKVVPTRPEAKTVAAFDWKNDAVTVKGGPGFLETEKTFGDFVFQIDAVTHAKELNSGFFFRAEPGTAAAPSNGYETQFNNAVINGDRLKPKDSGTGAIFRRSAARIVASDDFDWTTITLVAHGPQFATWVNGYPVVSWKDDRPADPNPRKGLRLDAGHISLQGHDPTTDVSFRKARIAPLPAGP